MGDTPDRRRFFKIATCTIGGGLGLVVAAPIVSLVLDPLGKQTVTTPREPIDLGPIDRFGRIPKRVDVIAPVVRDGWTSARDVVLGSAFIRRLGPNEIDARSAICPHLGCSVGWDRDNSNYLCPCHDSRFSVTGDKLTGPSERGLDALPIEIAEGRLRLTWERYQLGRATKERV
ncbi:MAG: ubiquinol-cytochrome c reductase iron-sulfur subunit [Kofleriaceae bacterium]